MPAAGPGNEGELDDEFIPEDARPVCPNCLKPCHPLQNYCDKCGSNQVINPLAAYMPFVDIRFNYGGFCTMWRKIWHSEDTTVTLKWLYLFIIVIFAPVILVLGLPFFLTNKIRNPTLQRAIIIVFYFLAFVLSMLLVSLRRF